VGLRIGQIENDRKGAAFINFMQICHGDKLKNGSSKHYISADYPRILCTLEPPPKQKINKLLSSALRPFNSVLLICEKYDLRHNKTPEWLFYRHIL